MEWKEIKSPILNEISPEYSLEGLVLKLQYFDHLIQRANSYVKTLMWERLRAGREGSDKGFYGWIHQGLNGNEFEQTSGDGAG